MKKTILLGFFVLGCSGPGACPATVQLNSQQCHEMCYPRKVDRYTKDGCFCTDGPTTPKPPPAVAEQPEKQ